MRGILVVGFPDGSDSKESACNAGDPGLIPGLGKFPWEGNDNQVQYFCLENSMDRGAWQAYLDTTRQYTHPLTSLWHLLRTYTHIHTHTHTHTHRPLWHLLRAKLSCIGGSGRGQVASSWWCWRRLQRQTKSPAASALRLCQGPRETLADAPQSRFGRKAEWCFELRCVCLPRTRRWCISAGC